MQKTLQQTLIFIVAALIQFAHADTLSLRTTHPSKVDDAIAGFLALSVEQAPIPEFVVLSEPRPKPSVLSKYSDEERMCVAKAIYFEARGEPRTGQLAVAHVIKNRSESNRFPTNLCDVVKQKAKKVCQFSWVCDRGMTAIKRSSEFLALADEALKDGAKDPTNGAMFFHTAALGNVWKKKVRAKIGGHVFF
jgi:spore germination cell wall hydrolase CwlJ-like protein